MAKYYVNGFNSTDTGDYTTPETGATNFHTLFVGLGSQLVDGDEIEISFGDVIDDSLFDIPIDNKLTITGNDIPVLLKDDGWGFRIYMDGVVFDGMYLTKADFLDNTLIDIHANNTTIKNCNLSYTLSTGVGSSINIANVSRTIITNTHINVPLGSPFSYGVYAESCSYSTITNNVLDMNGNNGQAITFLGASHHNDLSYNIIGNFLDATSGNVSILFNGTGSYNKITHNAMGISGPISSGIVYSTSVVGGIDVEIEHNFIAVRENDFSSAGIFIPYDETNTESYYSVINNIVEYRDDVIEATDDSTALNISIQRGVINFNDLYGFTLPHIFVNNGAPDIISELGDKCIFVDPRTVWGTDPTKYLVNDIRRYYVSSESECIGSGLAHHNIGVGVDGVSVNENSYINIVDTVTNNFGAIENRDQAYNTFFNNVITETPQFFNTNYRGTITGKPYPSDDTLLGVYSNQWEYVMAMTFPFTVGDHFYNKDFFYILHHKGDLQPFPDIKCPSNPGYGYDEYVGYETGLWGFPRANYRNGCFPDPCIIQDSYIDTIRIEDTILDVAFWIQDAIDPECLEESETGSDNDPVITVTPPNPLRWYQYVPYVDPGATAYDVEDGDITSSIVSATDVDVSTIGQYFVLYSVIDSDENQATAIRIVNVILPPDNTPPIITIIDDDDAHNIIPQATVGGPTTWSDPGATAYDARDGNLTPYMNAPVDNVNAYVLGTYSVKYSVSDFSGNYAEAFRYVTVIDPNPVLGYMYNSAGIQAKILDTDGDATIDPTNVATALTAYGMTGASVVRIEILPAASYIGGYSFQNFSGINTPVTIPNTILNIGISGFNGCSKATNLIFEATCQLTSINVSVFSGWIGVKTPSNVVIPASVQVIGENAFYGWTEIPGGLLLS